jgi:hypothetical protein
MKAMGGTDSSRKRMARLGEEFGAPPSSVMRRGPSEDETHLSLRQWLVEQASKEGLARPEGLQTYPDTLFVRGGELFVAETTDAAHEPSTRKRSRALVETYLEQAAWLLSDGTFERLTFGVATNDEYAAEAWLEAIEALWDRWENLEVVDSRLEFDRPAGAFFARVVVVGVVADLNAESG